VGIILPVASRPNCGNVHVRFSTFFNFRKRRKNKKNVKKRKKNVCYIYATNSVLRVVETVLSVNKIICSGSLLATA